MKNSLMISLLTLVIGRALTTTAVAQLSGDYIIGPGRTYTTLGAAITALNTSGASGPVRFLIDGNLSETGSPIITTPTLNGTPATLVIKPNTGRTPTVTLSGCVTAGNNAYAGLTIDGGTAAVGYVTIDGSNTNGGTTRDLTFTLNDTTAGKFCINAVGNADFVTVKNCKFLFAGIMDQSVAGNRGAAVRTNGTAVATANDNITIQNNEIGTATQAAGYGILVSNAASTYSTAVSILDNMVFGSTVPINTLRANTGTTTLTISGNEVSLIGFDTPLGYSEYGIWVDNSTGTVNITNNKLIKVNGYNSNAAAFPVYGIFCGRQNAGSIMNIANNFITNFSWQGTNTTLSNISALRLAGTMASTYNVYFNSINLNGNNLNGNASTIVAFDVVNALSTVNLKNNIVINGSNTATSFAISFPTTTALVSDYNDLYVSGANANVGSYNAVAQQTLANWQTASGQDANSNSFNPNFVSTTNLHLNLSSRDLRYVGTPIPGYTTDIDGQTRNSTHPYKGADEVSTYPLSVQDEIAGTAPGQFMLMQNYPNPFNPTTVVRYQLPAVSDVKLQVYDILGREVAMLVNERKNAGTYTVQFDALGLSSGVYLYVLTAEGYRESRRMTLVH